MSGDGIWGRLIIGFTTLDSYHKTQNDQTRNHIHFLLSQVLRIFISCRKLLLLLLIIITGHYFAHMIGMSVLYLSSIGMCCWMSYYIILYYIICIVCCSESVMLFPNLVIQSSVPSMKFPQLSFLVVSIFSCWNVHAVAPVQLFLLDETHLHLVPQTSDHFTMFPAISSNVKVIKLHQIVMNKSYHNGFPKRSKKKTQSLLSLCQKHHSTHVFSTSISDRQRHVLAPQDPQLNELLPAGPPFEEGTEALPNQLVLIYHARLALGWLGWACNMVTDIIVW